MTLNGVMVVILRYLAEFGVSTVNYVKLVEVRLTLSATKTAPESSFWPFMIHDCGRTHLS